MEDLRRPEVFAEYYQKVYRDMYRMALCVLGNSHDAEDAVGEAVADAFASAGKLRDPQAFKAWIFAILSNKCRRRQKEYARRPQELPEELAAPGGMEEAVQVRQAFARLEQEDRLLISMQVFGGYKSHEIGRILGMNPNTVRSRISRALTKMRECLE